MTKKTQAVTKAGAAKPKAKPRGRPFQKGNKHGGRTPGSRNRLSEAFLKEFCTDFDKHGAEVIAEVRETNPAKYLEIAARLLPSQVEVSADINIFEKVWTAISDGTADRQVEPVVIDEKPLETKH